MKILLGVHQFFPSRYAGTERLTLDLARQLQRQGHQVTVVTYAIVETALDSALGPMSATSYGFQGIPVTSLRHQEPPADLDFALANPRMEEAAQALLAQTSPDIVHITHPLRIASLQNAAKKLGIPVVLSLTDFWVMCPKGSAMTGKGEFCSSNGGGLRCVTECFGWLHAGRLVARAARAKAYLKAADRIVCGTRFMRNIFAAGDPTLKVDIIEFGIDYEHVQRNNREYTDSDEITIGMMSMLAPYKGAHLLVDAFKKAGVRNMRLRIYGEPLYTEAYYEGLKGRIGDDPRIELRGKYAPEEMPAILNQLDVLVMPSLWWENTPLVLLMALGHNVPAIVADVPGLTEVVHDGANGFVFEPGNETSLAEVLRRVGGSPSILNELKRRMTYPPRVEEMAFQYERLYEEVLRTRELASSKGSRRKNETPEGMS